MLNRHSRQTWFSQNRELSFLLILGLLFSFLPISAQTENSNPTKEKPDILRLKAVRVSEEIKIDGVLNETAWTTAETIKDFRQQEPNEGAAASEKTEIA